MERNQQILNDWKRIACEHDARAFESLFRLTNARFIRFCKQYVRDKETAEEIVSDVFVELWLNRHKLAPIGNPEVYLLICVKNKALNHLKKRASLQIVPMDEETEGIMDTCRPDEELERKELFMHLDKAIASLPHQCRIIFKLVKEDGMKCAEAAEILNISVRTVHEQLYRAMKKLHTSLIKHHPPSFSTVIRDIASAGIIIFFYFFLSACR